MKLNFIKALAVFLGTIIGAGIFCLPYVAAKAGFFVVLFYFLILSAVVFFIHFIYGKIAAGTDKIHRLPGYVERYIGSFWKKITFLVIVLGLLGALIAYLIIGGEFLKNFFSPYFGGQAVLYSSLFFGLGAILIFFGIRSVAQTELILVAALFVILLVFFGKTLPFINFSNFKNINLNFLPLPYGVIIFSLWGTAVVPEIKEMLGGDERKLKKVLFSGIFISALIYLFFIFIVFGSSGQLTSKEAISGLSQIVKNGIINLGFIFGTLTCFTSFVSLGLTLKKVLSYDFGLSSFLAWLIACFSPFILFLLGVKGFIEVIGFTGALMLGLEGIIIIFLYRAFLKKKYSQEINPVYYLLLAVFLIGVFWEVFYLLKNV